MRAGGRRRPAAPASGRGGDRRWPSTPDVLGRADQAPRGSPVHHRQGPLPRRHQAARHDLRGHPPQPVRAREHPLDRHLGGQGDAGRARRLHRRRHPVQPAADGLAGRRLRGLQNNVNTPRVLATDEREVDRRGRGARSSPRRPSRRTTRSRRSSVDCEPLPAVVDAEKATQPGAPQLHENAPNNVVFDWTVGDKDGTDAAIDEPRSWSASGSSTSG